LTYQNAAAMTVQEILKTAKEAYTFGHEYLKVDYMGMDVKFRMNKNHSRNHSRNDSNDMHNLSLVNVPASGSNMNSYFEVETREAVFIQKQIWGVTNWNQAKKEIIEFLSDIEYQN
jgi:hypothetical protein